ncbi:MAG TPA: aminotransferase class III-fold pyridoxal phosphate-dependent enzyme [Pyrinomonadaceae bacterium]|nr:aminotransferase class III-fold pyridoxal phosphate-dependent enzyme [Pyrinomonadaceae bacterium]
MSISNLTVPVDTPYERVASTLKALLAKMVGITPDAIDVRATFPEMGADSLFLLEVSHLIRDKFGAKVPFRAMLHEYSTIDALTTFIVSNMAPEEPEEIVTPEQPQPVVSEPETGMKAELSTSVAVSETTIERLLTRQMQLMTQQLNLLQAERQRKTSNVSTNGSHATTSAAPEVVPIKPPKDFVPASYVAHTSIKKDSEGLTPRQRKHIDQLITRLNKRTQGSKQLTQDYRHVLANNRANAGFNQTWKEMVYPLVTASASGGRVTDVDGNEYVDLVMGFGALLFGHSPSFLVETMQEQIARGLQLGAESHLAGKVAALVSELTGMNRVTFCNSGTEAVMSALRLARMVTGRSKIVLFEGCYHGSFDGVQVRPGKNETLPLTPGTTANTARDVLMLKFDDPESLKIIEEHGRELAAVLVEPLPSRRPDLQPKAFLHELRRITSKHGITLIFDEVVTGFRLQPGGAQALYDVKADLVTYGKALGGGLPVSAIAGKAEYLDTIDGGNWNYGDSSYPQSEMTLVTGTFFRNPLMMAVVWNILREIQRGGIELYQELERRAASLAARLNAYFEQDAVPIRMMQVQSMLRFVPHRDVKFMSLFYYHLLEHGVYVSETRSCFVSTAHTDEDFDRIVTAVKRTVAAMREGEVLGSLSTNASGEQKFRLPLTEPQKAIWALTQLGENASRAYHESSTLEIRGPFDVAAIRESLQELVDRHDALRMVFGPEGDFQYVQSQMKIDVPLIDFSFLDQANREEQKNDWLTKDVQRSFDLTHGPLIRAGVVKLEEQHHLLVITIHHIVSDGWSNGILQNELAALYTARLQGVPHELPAPVQFSEYVLSQASEESSEFLQSESYWLEKYRDSVPVLALPADKPRPIEPSFAGHRQTMTLDTSTYFELKQWSAQQDVTLFTTLLAAFNVLLHHLTKQSDLVVGIHAAGQLAMPGGDNLIGHCVNLLPLRSRVSCNPTFVSYLSEVKQTAMEAYEHQTYPVLRLIKKLNLRRDPSRMPLIAVVFNLDKVKVDDVSAATPAEQRVIASSNPPSFLQWELSLNIIEANNKLLVGCDHQTDLFEVETVRRWMDHYETILRTVLAEPEIRLLNISKVLDELEMEKRKATERVLDSARMQKFQSIKRQPVYSH